MKKIGFFFFLFSHVFSIMGQNDFQFEKKRDKVCFSFKLINNLVFIPVKVNGVELTFLLDTGVSQTVLFGVEEKNNLRFKNTEKITIKGFGSDAIVDGLKSTDNIVEIKGMKSHSYLLYVILDEEFNFSSHIGIPVNGIIGYSFFKNNLVKIDYRKKRITVYKDSNKRRIAIARKFVKTPITIEDGKPYLIGKVKIHDDLIPVKLLVDIGNSDSIWLFENEKNKIKVPNKNFEDYLGRGFSGDVMGRRAQIEKFEFFDFKFDKPIVAFPDTKAIQFFKFISERMGSVGGEIFKRFTLVMDYKNNSLFLTPNKMFEAPFLYNKSGIEIMHSGMQLVRIEEKQKTISITTNTVYNSGNEKGISDLKYSFKLKPIYEISNVREKSTAATCGIQKGDVIVSINNQLAYKYTLQELNNLLKSDHEKWITLEVDRNGKILVFKFQLVDIL